MNHTFDQSVLDCANSLIKGQGDGRISEHDMDVLLNLEYESSEQMATLLHIFNTFKLTDPAKKKMLESLQIKK